jgi:hypothetical protein
MCTSIPGRSNDKNAPSLVLHRCISTIHHYYQSYQTVLESPYKWTKSLLPSLQFVTSTAKLLSQNVSEICTASLQTRVRQLEHYDLIPIGEFGEASN